MRKFIAILMLLIVLPLYATAEENYTIGKMDRNGTLGQDGRSTRQAWINTLVGEGATSNDFETYLYFTDPTATRSQSFQDASGTIALVETIGSTLPLADTKLLVGQVSGLGVAKNLTFTGDLSGTMPNTGTWNAQIVANAVGNTEIDNTANYIVNDLTITGDLTVQGESNPIGEMHGDDITVTLSAAVWANVTSMTSGLMSSSMIQNTTDGSVTVTYPGIYKFVSSDSIADNVSASEEYHLSVAINGVDIEKCEQHRSISNQAKLGSMPVTCALPLIADDVVTMIANSVGGDDLTLEHINWMLFK